MTPMQIQLVRESFARVAPIAPQAAAIFYRHLFTADPTLAPLFKGDMAHQGERLMKMIGAAVGLLDRPQQLLPVLRQLGARHAGYRVQPAHYDTVGSALLQTLADGLGEAFDAATREAWIAMYAIVARTMLAGAAEAAQPVAEAA
ncbi:MAG: hemin receptor [Rubrivivax sp.]|nr:hemin receptor [Rubrivivax sp.]